jgi:hypothetical protein
VEHFSKTPAGGPAFRCHTDKWVPHPSRILRRVGSRLTAPWAPTFTLPTSKTTYSPPPSTRTGPDASRRKNEHKLGTGFADFFTSPLADCENHSLTFRPTPARRLKGESRLLHYNFA